MEVQILSAAPLGAANVRSPTSERCRAIAYPTVNEADALRVAPSSVQVTVCVPVPGVVVDEVPYVQLTAPSEPAVSCTCRPAAVEMRPEGSLAWALQTAPGLVFAAT